MSDEDAVQPDEVVADPEPDTSVVDDVGPQAEPESEDEANASSAAAPEGDVDYVVAEVVDAAATLGELTLDDVLAATAGERDEFKDHLVRLQADFDNYRKRAQRELAEAGDKALGRFVASLLPVLDAVDAARAHAQITGDVDHVSGLLIELLGKQGLERMGAEGDVFDPTQHEAVLHEAGEEDVQTVAQLLRAGWNWRGRVLRPAMVKVVGG